MPVPHENAGTCLTCGAQLDLADDLGCMACLLRVGLEEITTSESDPSSPPDQFGAYAIERRDDGSPWELGRGAMGVTYRAVDTSLQRSVALKIIKTDLANRTTEARERFIREARIAAALRHPNVATVHHFGVREETGQCFCAMELVEGETLEERVRRMGPLDVETVVEVGCQIAAALIAAEKRGLVHRDLKPANVMITAGEEGGKIAIKVIDFGVAKALAETPDARVLTHHGFIGTPAFASPEQFANAPVDTRSDIYSLGATLWYLLTGHMPFGERVPRMTPDIRQTVAPPIEQLKTARVPSSLISLLVSMLALEPAARPNVRELAARLGEIQAELLDPQRRLRRFALAAGLLALVAGTLFLLRPFGSPNSTDPGTAPPEKSIAVLPFENRSADKENAFFADGIQDDVLTSLVKIRELKVIGRSSVMSYRDPAKRNLREIGRQLGVAHVLEGSVQREGDRVRVNVQLIDARDHRQVWAERYDRTVADSIGLQGELAIQIAAALRATLAPEEKVRLDAKPTQNFDAYALYLKAREREQAVDFITQDIMAAEELYAQAIALDPAFALAHARASITNNFIYVQANEPARKLKARSEAEEALRLSPTLGEAHLALGLCLFLLEKDYEAALKQFALAEKASPNNAESLHHSASIYRRQGRWREALAAYQRAQELDPRDAVFIRRLAGARLMVRDWQGAAADFDRVLRVAPDSLVSRINLAYLEIVRNGNLAAASARLPKIPDHAEDGFLTSVHWDMSMLERDFATAQRILDRYPFDDFAGGDLLIDPKSYYQAQTALARGDVELAQRFFEKARLLFEAEVRDHPDEPRRRAYLGIVNAYMGRKEDAIREARRAAELEPESKDAYHGALIASKLALVYARAGEPDQAITLIERLLGTPGAAELGSEASITLEELRLRWCWDPLRNNPRFQKLLEGPEPKTIY